MKANQILKGFAWVFLLLLPVGSALIVTIVFGVEETFRVTDDENYITIENDYYIAKVEKASGRLYNFYIKPYDADDIVCTWTGHSIGGHEYECYNGSDAGGEAQWSSVAGAVTLYDTSIVLQTSDVVTVMTSFLLNDTDNPWGLSRCNITEWKTFYADKPYMLTTFNRDYLDDHNFLNEQQTCFLFNPDWVSDARLSDLNGNIVSDTETEESYSFFQKGINKFPWYYFANSTHETGFGTILLGSYPNTARIGHYFLSGDNYVEYQITQNTYTSGGASNDENSLTYINYVASNESEIDTFSENLYKSMDFQQDATLMHTGNNYEHVSYGGVKKVGGMYWNYYSTLWKVYPWIIGDENGNNYEPYYTNSSGSYALVTSWDNSEYADFLWNTSYLKSTYQTDFESKIRYAETVELWADSDVMKVFLNVTTLASANVTDLYLRWRECYPYANSDLIQLSTDIIKMNCSSAFTNWIADNGLAIKNMSGTTEIDGVYMKYYPLDRVSDQEYASGTSWTITLYVQNFLRLDRDFTASDFLNLNESEMMNQLYHAYMPLPFPDFPASANATLFLKYIGRANFQVPYSTFSNDVLTLNIVGESGTTSTIEVYCGDKGEPTSVSGASSWSYDSETKIVTINVLHTSSKEVIVYFAGLVPEFPLGVSMEIGLITIIIFMWWKNRRKISRNISR